MVTKQEEVVEKLRQLAQRSGPGAKLPKFLALRDQFGVSGTTLTAALDELERQRVLVRRHGVGIYVSEEAQHRNLVLLCDPVFFEGEVSPFWEMLVKQARARAAERAEDLVLHFIRPTKEMRGSGGGSFLPPALVEEIKSERVQGILGLGLNAWVVEEIMQARLPFVAFAGYGPCAVAFDMDATARLGVEALATAGCRRIALWSAVPAHLPLCRDEILRRPIIAAFQGALDRQGLVFDPSLVRLNAHRCPDVYPKNGIGVTVPSAQEQGKQTAGEVFEAGTDPHQWPDGIVCMEDTMLQGALPVFSRLNLRPGREVMIATHANIGSPVLFGYEEALIRIAADPSRLVQEMYELLEAQMAGETPERPQRLLEPTLFFMSESFP